MYIYIYVYIPGTQTTSIFEGHPPKTRLFPIKTRVIWVPGRDTLPETNTAPELWLEDEFPFGAYLPIFTLLEASFKGQLGVPLTVYPWYLLCSLGILGDYNP